MSHSSRLLPLLLAVGCSDYDVNLHGKDATPPFDDGEDSTPGTDTDSGTTSTTDSVVPDGCPDLVLAEPETLPVGEACAAGPTEPERQVVNPWSAKVDWGFAPEDPTLAPGMTPGVGNLDDDDGDGDVDGDDVPEVVVVSGSGVLVVLDGRDGAVKWTVAGVWSGIVPLIADVDVDGVPDLVAVTTPQRKVVVYDALGAEKWRSADGAASPYSLQAADLDADGTVEVVADDLVVDGLDGATRFRMETPGGPWITNAVADVDLDGDQEILRAGVLYDSDGAEVWRTGVYGTSVDFPLVVQADADRDAELAVVTNRLRVYDTDGTLLVESALFRDVSSTAGLPCAGDFDGDGAMEVAVPVYMEGPFLMLDLDGRVAWEDYGPTRSLAAGCSGYDFDGDGALEVVYPADEALYVFDGATGDVRLTYTGHASPTFIEYAVVADVDADDHAEIVFMSQGSGIPYALTALGHDGEGWPAAGPAWSDGEFHVTAVRPDGSVPTRPDPAWLTNKVYRARTALDGVPGQPDLVASVTDVCVASCDDGPVELSISVGNQGGASVDAGTPLAVYAVEADGERLVAVVTLPAFAPGERPAGFAVPLTRADLGARGFRVVADDDGTGFGALPECDEDNNVGSWLDTPCP